MRARKQQDDETSKNEGKPWNSETFKELQIAERTQVPPGAELIERLNKLASKPPFCWTKKYNERAPR